MSEKQKNPKLLKLLLITLAVFFVGAASFHICVAIIASIDKERLFYLNPIRLLGVNYLWPKYQDSASVTIGLWGALTLSYLVGVYFHAKNKGLNLLDKLPKHQQRATSEEISQIKESQSYARYYLISSLINLLDRSKGMLIKWSSED